MKGRGRFIRGAFRRPLAKDKDEHALGAERGATAAEPHDPANDVIDDVRIPYPPQDKVQTSKLSSNARDLLNGREVMLSDSYSDDVSSINDSVYMEAVNRPSNNNLLVGGPEAFNRAASKREEILLLSDAESFGRHAPTRVASLYAARVPKSSEGSTAEKPINLLGSRSDDEDSLESGLSLSSNALKNKLDAFKSTYLDTSSNHPEATEVLSYSSNGNSREKEKTVGPQTHVELAQRSPRWFRLALFAIGASFVGAVVLLALAVSNSNSSVEAASKATDLEFGTAENGDNSGVQSVPTLMQPTPADVNSPTPVPAPSGFVLPPVGQSTIESIFALITRAPTANPAVLTNPPTTSPTRATIAAPAMNPTSEPSMVPSSIPTIEDTLAPSEPMSAAVPALSEMPTAVASNEPTLIQSSTPTIVPTTLSPTLSPTIDTVDKMVIYLTAGRIDESANLHRFPTRKMTSFLVHLGDWNEEEKCDQEDYQGVTQKFANSSVPVYFVMGDDGKRLVI